MEPTSNILVVNQWIVDKAEDLFRGMGIKVVIWSRYLGGFIGDREAEDIWLAEKVKGWEESVKTLPGSLTSTPIPLTQDCISHSNMSGNWCNGSPPTLGMPSSQRNKR